MSLRWAIPVITVVGLGAAPALAQSSPAQPTTEDPSIQLLLKRIEELEASQKQMQQRLDKLTGTPAAPAAAPLPMPAEPSEPAAVPADDSDDGHIHTLGPVQFQGFTDFDFGRAWFDQLPPGGLPGTPNSFTLGDFDLFTNTRISDHWSVLGEVLVTSDLGNEFSAEIDRLLLTYKANDRFKISFGKFNTAFGYYSNAFERAHYFQTAVSRPIMYGDEDDGGIMPVHNIGVTATGKVPSGALGLHWVAEVANGVAYAAPEPIQNFVDENNSKAVNVAMYARPDFWSGFQAGFSLYRDTLHPMDGPTVGQTIYTGHIVYVGGKLEWLNEASLLRHAVESSDQVSRTLTSYTQLSWAFGRFRPYFRYDYQNIPQTDPVFGALGRENGPTIGVARHISTFLVLKLQYGRLSERQIATANDLNAQLAVAF